MRYRGMAHRAADDGAPRTWFALRSVVHRPLDANANGMRTCALNVRTWRRIADVSGSAAGMQIMRRIFGCGWGYNACVCCGVQCMCTGPIATG